MNKMFVFVSAHEVEFMRQFFTTSFATCEFYVSGGDCNPIKYEEEI